MENISESEINALLAVRVGPSVAALALAAAGVRLLPEEELLSFGEAAGRLLGDARILDYNGVKLEYLQSFGPLR